MEKNFDSVEADYLPTEPGSGDENSEVRADRPSAFDQDSATKLCKVVPVDSNTPVSNELYPEGFDRHLKQSENVGDCYFVAALYALRRNPIFPYVVDAMVSRTDNGWEVHFPDSKFPIEIQRFRDLDGQMIQVQQGDLARKTRFKPIEGELGDKVLERAFARDRKIGCFGDKSMMVVVGGTPEEPLGKILGKYGSIIKFGASGIKTINEELTAYYRAEIESMLINFALDPKSYVLTASTPQRHVTPYYREGDNREFGDGRVYFMDENKFFYQEHAYVIEDYDVESRRVTIVNPHDTKNLRMTISIRELMKYFRKIYGVRLDRTKILQNLGEVPEFEENIPKEGIYNQPLVPGCKYEYSEVKKENECLRVHIGRGRFLVFYRPDPSSKMIRVNFTQITESDPAFDDIQNAGDLDSGREFLDSSSIVFGHRYFQTLGYSREELIEIAKYLRVEVDSNEKIIITSYDDKVAVKVERMIFDRRERLHRYSEMGLEEGALTRNGAFYSYELKEREILFAKLINTEDNCSVPILDFEVNDGVLYIGYEDKNGNFKDLDEMVRGELRTIGRMDFEELYPKLSRDHLLVKFGEDGRIYLRDLSQNGVYIEGVELI